jgi:hypothetical protein
VSVWGISHRSRSSKRSLTTQAGDSSLEREIAPPRVQAGAKSGKMHVDLCPRGDCTKKPTAAHGGILAGRRWCVVNAADRVIRWSTALAVLGVAAIAAVVSYEHASALARAHGESGWTGRLIPLTMDGVIYASSMVMLDATRRDATRRDATRRGARVPALARWLLGLGIAATLAANVSHGLGHGVIGAAVAAWPALALVGSYELLMVIIRGAHMPLVTPSAHDEAPMADPLSERAAAMFAADLADDRVPSIRAIRGTLHVGQPRAQRLREYLAIVAEMRGGNLAA